MCVCVRDDSVKCVMQEVVSAAEGGEGVKGKAVGVLPSKRLSASSQALLLAAAAAAAAAAMPCTATATGTPRLSVLPLCSSASCAATLPLAEAGTAACCSAPPSSEPASSSSGAAAAQELLLLLLLLLLLPLLPAALCQRAG
jgi:hypothetical protein